MTSEIQALKILARTEAVASLDALHKALRNARTALNKDVVFMPNDAMGLRVQIDALAASVRQHVVILLGVLK